MSGNYLRMRGEYQLEHGDTRSHEELPPHARRIQSCQVNIPIGNGTTSACAENTAISPPPGKLKRNYLRMRGEYLLVGQWSSLFLELPPHARRILVHRILLPILPGTTSACAENTSRKIK